MLAQGPGRAGGEPAVASNWCLADADTDLGLGNITLFNIYRDAVRDAELGYWAHPDAQGRGVMTEAIERVARWYFAPRPRAAWPAANS